MAVSDSVKVDLLLKKLYGVAKTDTATNKSPSNEAISSPLLIRGDTIWTQANSIPTTAASLAGVVQSYLTTNRIECTPDTTTQRISGTVYPTWRTNLTNWIAPEFDTVNLINSYRVRVYYGATGLSDPASTGGTQIFADGSGSTGEWYFDYVTGTLNLIGGTIPSGMNSSSVIYIYGYRYIGSTSINTLQPPINTNLSITTTGTGVLQVNSFQTVFNSTDSIQIPVGTTAQRDSTPVLGQIRYNSELTTFEGFGPGSQWGSLGGVIDVDRNTYILAEFTPTANDNTLWFYNDGVETLTITKTDVDFKSPVIITINNTTDTTGATDGALKVLGGVMVAKDLFVGGGDIITDEATFNLLNTTPTTINAFDNATDVNIANVTTSAVTVDIATAATSGASTLTFGGAVTGNTFEINSVAAGTINLSSDVTTGIVNLYTGLTTGTVNIGSAANGRVVVEFTTNSTTSTNGALVVKGGIGVANDIVGAGFTVDGVTGAVTETSSIISFVIDEGEY